MKNLVKLTCGLAVVMFLIAASAGATVIADWTFETSFVSITGSSTSLGGIAPEHGAGTASGVHASSSAWSTPVGINPESPDTTSLKSFSANNWSIGDYWQFQITTATIFDPITVSWDQTGSATGPKDYLFEYSTDNTSYTPFGPAITLLVNSTPFWGTTVVSTKYTITENLGTAVQDSANVYFRVVLNSSVALNGAGVGAGGADRVDNFKVESVPEPSSVMLVGIGLASLVLAIRRRRS